MSNKTIASKFVLLSLACIVSGLIFTTQVSAAQPKKQRRIIINDDGGAYAFKPGQTIEYYVKMKFKNIEGTQIDSYFVCVGHTDMGRENSKREGLPQFVGTLAHWFHDKKLPDDLDKLTRAYIDTAHNANMEIFASIRLNDVHDTLYDKLYYPLKVQRPDLLLDYPAMKDYDWEKNPYFTYPPDAVLRMLWSGFDWSKQEVRDHFHDFIVSYFQQYDFDGLELDYCRFMLYFKFGEAHENIDKMTDFVRQVRKGLNEIGRKRGRPFLLTARVPDSPAVCRRMGLDVEQWLKEGLMDLLIVGAGYSPYSGRLKEFIDMAHKYDIQAYPCIGNLKYGPIMINSVMSNFWSLGADGVYVFNWYGLYWYQFRNKNPEEMAVYFNQIGDPETLLGLDKLYKPDNGETNFNHGANSYRGIFPQPDVWDNATRVHPVWLIDETPIELVVGDDLAKAGRDGLIKKLTMKVKVKNMVENERITTKINGVYMPRLGKDFRKYHPEKNLFILDVKPEMFRRGINEIAFSHGRGAIGRLSAKVTGLELIVDYK